MNIQQMKQEIIRVGKLLWEKNLISAVNGNISLRFDDKQILLTATKTCKGFLTEHDIVRCDYDGKPLDGGSVSSEKKIHTEVYKNFPEVTAVIHTHTPYINGYFLDNPIFYPRILEAKLYIGEVRAIDQETPNVHDIQPVLEQLKSKGVVVLRNHGVLAVGPNLLECFYWIQNLEEAIKTELISVTMSQCNNVTMSKQNIEALPLCHTDTLPHCHTDTVFKFFSPEQMQAIVDVVNSDEKMQQLGEQTQMTMELAVKLDETGQVYSFNFEKGKIVKVGNNEKAEFLTSAPEVVWRAIFKREIDPFVATTQKKMVLRGDFAKISKWYAPCSRVFELWTKVAVE